MHYVLANSDCISGIQNSFDNQHTRAYFGMDYFDFENSLPPTEYTGRIIDIKVHPDSTKYPVSLLRVTDYSGLAGISMNIGAMPICMPDAGECHNTPLEDQGLCQKNSWLFGQKEGARLVDRNKMEGFSHYVNASILESDSPFFVKTELDHNLAMLGIQCQHTDAGEFLTCDGLNGEGKAFSYLYGVGKRCAQDGSEKFTRIGVGWNLFSS